MNIRYPSHKIRLVRIQGHGHWARKLSCNLSDNDEQHPKGILGPWSSHLSRWYSDILRKYGRKYQTSPEVLDQLEQHDLAVSLKKSVFNQEEVEFLGYIGKTSGVTISDRKVKSVQNWAHPRSVEEGQIFIGVANLYWQFIKDCSKVCKPITATLKGNPKDFCWGRKQEEAFEQLKRRFTTAPILSHFYPGRKKL